VSRAGVARRHVSDEVSDASEDYPLEAPAMPKPFFRMTSRERLEHKKQMDYYYTLKRQGQMIPEDSVLSGPVVVDPSLDPKLSAPVINWNKEQVGSVELSNEVFNQPIRQDIVHACVVWQRNSYRQGTHKTKDRSEVSGTGRKPHRQKGSGLARQGTRRAPHHRGGGVAHGKRVRSHATSLNKKVRALALKITLTAKFKEGNLIVLENATLPSHKTKDFVKLMAPFEAKSALLLHSQTTDRRGEVLTTELDNNLVLAARNIQKFDFLPQVGANVYSILRRQKLFVTKSALGELQTRLGMSRSHVKIVVPPSEVKLHA